ncbi:Receptor like protein 34 [Theobroma cacao]|uniref:Receptor like protein 34 n=1 Tax=Theobroma cacao TaxID=3641 RepID=A0A061FQZ9_THECC|nr:Receptor like protein 34 [Theobroma cacao]
MKINSWSRYHVITSGSLAPLNPTCHGSLKMFSDIGESSGSNRVIVFPSLISLEFSYNFLNRTLPSWLYTASSLKYISLSNNELNSDIKEFLYKSLEKIFLRNNKLKSPLPSSISQLVNLTHVSLSLNNLSDIVEFDMFSKLKNLQYLDLSYNCLSLNTNGTSADYTLPNLSSLYLSSCNVSEFPQFLKGLKRFHSLDLSKNRINGKIPKWMGDVAKDSLNLPIPSSTTNVFLTSNNSLSEEISYLICNADSLEFLDLSHNNLSGIIPQCFRNLSKGLSIGRFYSYSIGIAIKGLEIELVKIFILLTIIDLLNNEFQGEIPVIVRELNSLKGFNLSHNNLSGYIPTSLGNLIGLEWLDLFSNKLVGKVPEQLLDLTSLSFLILSKNELVGCIPLSKQFNTFENNSYEGNDGLCGLPLTRDCNNNEPTQQLSPSNL